MEAIVKLYKTTQNPTFFIVYSNNSGVLKCESFMGDSNSLKNRLEQIVNPPASYLLLEIGDRLLQQNGFGIVLE